MKEMCLLSKESGATTLIYKENAQTSQFKEICGWMGTFFILCLENVPDCTDIIKYPLRKMIEKIIDLSTSLQLSGWDIHLEGRDLLSQKYAI